MHRIIFVKRGLEVTAVCACGSDDFTYTYYNEGEIKGVPFSDKIEIDRKFKQHVRKVKRRPRIIRGER